MDGNPNMIYGIGTLIMRRGVTLTESDLRKLKELIDKEIAFLDETP